MKRLIVILLTALVSITVDCYCQERQNEERPKLEIQMLKQTDRISKITGWSRIENAQGKFWNQSDLGSGQSHLPSYPDASFDYIQLFQFKLEGGLYYLFTVKYSDESYRWLAFTESSLKNVRKIVEAANGQSYYTVDIKDCGYVVKDRYAAKGEFHFDPEEVITDKELIRLLLIGQGQSLLANFCKGDSLMLINSQVIKGDTVVRFNLIPWNNTNYDILPLSDDYFEVKKSGFVKFFHFIPYVPYSEQRKTDDLAKQNNTEEAIRKRQQYYDKLNETKVFKCDGGFVNRMGDLSVPKFISPPMDLSSLLDTVLLQEGKFNIVVGSNGKVVPPEKDSKIFVPLTFTPAKVKEKVFPSADNSPDAEFAVNMEIPVVVKYDMKTNPSFSPSAPAKIRDEKVKAFLILKLKKSNKGVEVMNSYSTDKAFMDNNLPRLEQNFAATLADKSNGKFYIYYMTKSLRGELDMIPLYSSTPKQLGFFVQEWNETVVKEFDSSSPDQRCP